jgi:hypothetical protein
MKKSRSREEEEEDAYDNSCIEDTYEDASIGKRWLSPG